MSDKVQKYHSELLLHCLTESDSEPSNYNSVECFTKHHISLVRCYLPNVPCYAKDVALMSALDERVDQQQNDLFLLRHIGNSVYDHMLNMAKLRPSPSDCANEADLRNTLPEIFGIDYNKKPY